MTHRDSHATQNDMTLNEWQIQEITRGVTEAECGDFASDEEVEQS